MGNLSNPSNNPNLNRVLQDMEQAERKKALKREAENMASSTVNAGNKLTTTLDIDFTSSEGNHYKGQVKLKRPSIGEMIQIGAQKSVRLRNAGVTDLSLVDDVVLFTNHIIATLDFVMVERPSWLENLDEMQDTDVLFHIYGEYEIWNNSFRRTTEHDGHTGDSSSTDGTSNMETT